MSQTNAPNQTLYVRNLNDKINKQDLRLSLYTLFTTYGVVIDVVASKTAQNRGQAFIAFRDVPSATQAMRALEGFNVFGREMKIAYAKTKSHKIAKYDGTFRMPGTAAAAAAAAGIDGADGKPFVPLPGSAPTAGAGAGGATVAAGGAAASPAADAVTGQKRLREEDSDDGEEAEMEMEDDDDD
ncbi:hypothetical protein BZA05DRAFT_400704 [Tricharina praecox]|uniref:uncharacterized protein n=1 Tax=Tricharina praecox TaxID=43433 RepID=UPI00221E793D|nr:uncharacterized protein BZA05DRAFT_400704 [Tricharina praecox]KAI5850039.1 hypothetical protein BZA05DRAFT_400704 [Tricharina praecox]